MNRSSRRQSQVFWTRLVMRKWLSIGDKASHFSADPADDDDLDSDASGTDQTTEDTPHPHPNDPLSSLRRRRKSETFRAQYINTKDLRICAGTWNVGGKAPPDDLNIDDWLHVDDPADIYVLGIQEIVPLNAGNIFGAEDSGPVLKWETIIRETLNRIRPAANKMKSFSDPPSPTKFKPPDDIPCIEEELLLDSDSDIGEEVHPLDDEINGFTESKDASSDMDEMNSDCSGSSKAFLPVDNHVPMQFPMTKRMDRVYCSRTDDTVGSREMPSAKQITKLTRVLSLTERIGLTWPEPPMHLLSLQSPQKPTAFKSSNSFRSYKSFKSFPNEIQSSLAFLADINLEALMKRKRSSFVRIVSKKMVGIFITVWVRRSLRRHIQNVKVSTVGVGVMGYVGNKGSVSVSMSIYQTLFCFICTHLTSGERDVDKNKRNIDVHEIHRRTQFHRASSIGLPKYILDHEKMIWLGDLNYRLNLSYDKVRELIRGKEWSQLHEHDQLMRELRKGRVFDGWSEGTLYFAPTYKYESNSDKYCGEDPKMGRRTPAWCDRILWYGKGMRLVSYQRAEVKLSDHRPVTGMYVAEVEVFSPRKLQRALTLTDAEIKNPPHL